MKSKTWAEKRVQDKVTLKIMKNLFMARDKNEIIPRGLLLWG